jgi:hypothetical protein
MLMSLALLCLPSSGIEKDSLSLGLGWNYRSYNIINGEVYLLFRESLFRSSDSKTGINVRKYSLNFDGVRNLQASSVGLTGEQIFYPFKKILFLGIRFDLSADWLSRSSKYKIESERNYTMPNFYYNFIGYIDAGVNLKLHDRYNIKLSVLPGVEDRGITNELFHIGASNQTNVVRESKNNFVFQVNLSVEFKLKK